MSEGLYPLAERPVSFVVSEPRRSRAASASLKRFLDSFDALLGQDRVCSTIERRLAREQRKLRRLSSDAVWEQYLRVEAAHMDRALRWLELAVERRGGRLGRRSS